MPTNSFQIAVQHARRNFSDAEWHSLNFSDQARAIYRELRLLDAEAAAQRSHDGVQPDGSRPEFDDVLQ